MIFQYHWIGESQELVYKGEKYKILVAEKILNTEISYGIAIKSYDEGAFQHSALAYDSNGKVTKEEALSFALLLEESMLQNRKLPNHPKFTMIRYHC